MAKYSVLQKWLDKHENLVTQLNGETVNLTGKAFKKEVPANRNKPAEIRTVRGATQADLKELYENDKHGNFSHIILKEDK